MLIPSSNLQEISCTPYPSCLKSCKWVVIKKCSSYGEVEQEVANQKCCSIDWQTSVAAVETLIESRDRVMVVVKFHLVDPDDGLVIATYFPDACCASLGQDICSKYSGLDIRLRVI